MISESMGEMRQVEKTLSLKVLKCLCWGSNVGVCHQENTSIGSKHGVNTKNDPTVSLSTGKKVVDCF